MTERKTCAQPTLSMLKNHLLMRAIVVVGVLVYVCFMSYKNIIYSRCVEVICDFLFIKIVCDESVVACDSL